ncbi:zinc finger domain-containing protein [Streptomyces sp. NPDC002537]
MNLDETYQLLDRVSMVDDRIVRTDPREAAGQADLWAAILADVPLPFAAHAVLKHYKTSPFALRPSDIAEQWRLYVRDRLERHTESEPPDGDTGDDTYQAALIAERRAVAVGEMEPRPTNALPPGSTSSHESRGRALLQLVGSELTSRRQEFTAPCPHCHSASGKPCTDGRGKSRRDAHPTRIEASRATAAGQPPVDHRALADEIDRRRAAAQAHMNGLSDEDRARLAEFEEQLRKNETETGTENPEATAS